MNTSEIIPLVRAFSKAPTDAQVTTAVDAWLDDHPEATTTVQDGAITKAKLDSSLKGTVDDVADLKSAMESLPKRFIKGHTLGTNLFDGSWGWEQGNYNNSVNYIVRSPEIPITAGQTYTIGVTDYDPSITISNVICRCFDANGNSLSLTNRSPKVGQKFTAPAGSVYAKVMLNTGAASINITPEMVESAYVHVLLIEGVIADRYYDGNNTCALNPADWTGSHLINLPWIDNYADYVCESVSIKDIPFEIGGIQSTDGAEVVNNKRIRSADYIYLEKGAYIGLKDSTNYTLLVAKYATPDASTFIGCKPLDNNPYILDESCYVRIVEGKSTAFDDVSAKNNIVMLKAFSPTNNRVIKATKAREIFAPDVTDYEYTGAVQSVPHPAGNFANVISMWDGLLSTHSNYMTKDEVGYDQSGEYKIFSYTISSNSDVWWANNHEIEGEKNLKLVWIAGIHGNEAYLEYEDYYFFKDLLENHDTNPALKAIWNNIDFVIVPVANPWGYDHNSRVNSRGVNINRNFPFEWELTGEGTVNYSGESAASELETRAIMRVCNKNDDAFFIVNRHGTNTFSDAGIFGYTTSRYLSDEEIGRALAKNIDQYMKANFSWVTGDVPTNKKHLVFSWKEDKYATGTFDPWANSCGWHGILIESGNVLYSSADNNLYPNGSIADVQRIDTTVVGKTILAYMLHNKYMLSDRHMWHEIEQ